MTISWGMGHIILLLIFFSSKYISCVNNYLC